MTKKITNQVIRYFILSITLSLMVLISPLHANEWLSIDINKILDAVEDNYASMNSFKAEFKQDLFHRESNTTQKRTGELLFEQENNIRWITHAPYAEEIIVNKKEIWNYLPDEEIAYRYGPEMLEQSHIALSVITGKTKIIDNFEVELLGEEVAPQTSNTDDNKTNQNNTNNTYLKLVLFPFDPTTNLVEAELWIDTEKNLIKKIVVSDFYSNTNSIDFESIKPNAKVRKKDFTFNPPKGVTVEDHSKD